jgi:hypothetical protein
MRVCEPLSFSFGSSLAAQIEPNTRTGRQRAGRNGTEDEADLIFFMEWIFHFVVW